MKKASKKKSILKGIIDFGMYNTLEERLRNSPEYKKSRKRVGKESECTVEVTFRLYLCSSDYAVQIVKILKKENE